MKRSLLVTLAVLTTLISLSSYAQEDGFTTQFLQRLNEARKEKKANPVSYSPSLTQIANQWLSEAHGPNEDVCDRVGDTAFCSELGGGNLPQDANRLIALWRPTLSNSAFSAATEFGLGSKQAGESWTYLLIMSSPKPAQKLSYFGFLERFANLRRENKVENRYTFDPCLMKMAKYWAEYHADHQLECTHEADGIDLKARAKQFGCQYSSMAENVGRFLAPDASLAFEGWLNSPDHRANMLKPWVTQLGLACVEAPLKNSNLGKTVCVLVLGAAPP